MCTGAEIFTVAQVFGAVAGGAAAIKALTTKPPTAPEIVRTDPAADELAAKTAAAQEGQAATSAARLRARQNSLLSQAGAAGDLSTADTAGGRATPKSTLGS